MASFIFTNGTIISLDESQSATEALAVIDDKIVYCGELSIAQQKAPGAQQIDLQGKTVLPGFIDSHLHLLNTALVKPFLDLTPFTTSTYDQAIQKIQVELTKLPPDGWLIGFGYDPSLIQGPKELTVQDLDKVAPNHPLLILNLSGHLAYVNTKAYQTVGITNQTPDPVSGRIMKDAQGNLTGIIEEIGAIDLFISKIPQPPAEELVKETIATAQEFAANGCTTITDAGVGDVKQTKDIDILKALVTTPKFPIRITGFLTSVILDQWKTLKWFKPNAGDENLRFVKIKVWADGSTQGYTAALRQPYLNSDQKGFLNYKNDGLRKVLSEIIELGWPIAVHCNGDAALEQTIGALETLLKPDDPKNICHRIEHCTIADEQLLERMKKLNITPSFTIGHVYYWGKVFRDNILGPERATRLDAADYFVKNQLPFSYNSDAFTTPVKPLQYIQTAVTRKMKDGGEVLGMEHCISVDEAIKAVTLYPAIQLGLADQIGSLKEGLYADLVILDQDPRKIDPNQIANIKVLETWKGGVRFPRNQ